MSALSVIGANLITSNMAPLSESTGGSSKSNPGAGSGSTDQSRPKPLPKITTKDRAGAGILTFLVCCVVVGGGIWIIL